MTQAEWAVCEQPADLMRHLHRRDVGSPSGHLCGWLSHSRYGSLPRKWRLFLAACCWRTHPMQPAHARRLIEAADAFAEAIPTEEERLRLVEWFGSSRSSRQVARLLWGMTCLPGQAAGELRNVVGHHARKLTSAGRDKEAAQRAALDAEARAHCDLLRDVFGDPFRTTTFDPAWRSADVASIAQAAYDERTLPSPELDRHRLAVLADALEDAGCADEEVLTHLRRAGLHVRGCWVVDLCLAQM